MSKQKRELLECQMRRVVGVPKEEKETQIKGVVWTNGRGCHGESTGLQIPSMPKQNSQVLECQMRKKSLKSKELFGQMAGVVMGSRLVCKSHPCPNRRARCWSTKRGKRDSNQRRANVDLLDNWACWGTGLMDLSVDQTVDLLARKVGKV